MHVFVHPFLSWTKMVGLYRFRGWEEVVTKVGMKELGS